LDSGLRRPAVAGFFYPGEPAALAGSVDAMLAAAPPGPRAPAYVVPHAGYAYSGPAAARAYAGLRGKAADVRRIVLLGPSHRVPLAGCAVPAARAWATPLGELPVDVAGARGLFAAGLAALDDAPHAREHSLEVQLPFLQRVLPAPVPILPVAVGEGPPARLAETLAAAVTDGTVVLCSTDLSHYQPEPVARRQDARTVQAILDLAPERIGPRDACGRYALRGLLHWAAREGLRPRLLQLCTSADTAGDPDRVVGYAAFALPVTVAPR
jgi:AmmeMemoRadiSam system protein B